MSDTITHCFTFGSNHTTSYELAPWQRLHDGWVEVELPAGHGTSHRQVFINHFTLPYCPRAGQFAFEYEKEKQFDPQYFPHGCLLRINADGIIEQGESDG